ALKNNKGIKILDLSRTLLEWDENADGRKAISEMLKENHSLVELNLAKTMLNDKGVGIIAKNLKENSTLEQLILRNCLITDRGCNSLITALRENKAIKYLDLSGNQINKSGKEIAEYLSKNPQIAELDLSNNDIR